jgi:hypothetical protein
MGLLPGLTAASGPGKNERPERSAQGVDIGCTPRAVEAQLLVML